MKFFFPDSQDLVDPSFDFEKETRSDQRLRHRDDLYAHEVFSEPAYDGVLVSKASVDGKAGESGRYTLAQRHRLSRVGVRDFFRLPVGVAQGWSPNSYAEAVKALQKMGYEYIGLGGMVPLKTEEIMACLEGANDVRRPQTRFHLFGVTRPDHIGGFQQYGVVSFDSTSPLRQAFKHDRENYYTLDGTYSAIRVPQVEGNASVQKRIVAGEIDQGEARRLEQACLRALRGYDKGACPLNQVLAPLREYDCLFDGRKDRTEDYRKVLVDRPWKNCSCSVCRQIGIDVVFFRGAERNRRRGFHNVFITYQRLHRELALLRREG